MIPTAIMSTVEQAMTSKCRWWQLQTFATVCTHELFSHKKLKKTYFALIIQSTGVAYLNLEKHAFITPLQHLTRCAQDIAIFTFSKIKTDWKLRGYGTGTTRQPYICTGVKTTTTPNLDLCSHHPLYSVHFSDD